MANEIPQAPERSEGRDEAKPQRAPFITPPPSYPEIPGRPKKDLAKVIFGIIVIVLLGAGVSLAARIWDPLWNPFRPSPEAMIAKMAKKMEEVKTLRSETKLELGAKEDTKETFKMAMSFRGDSDVTDAENPKSAGDFDIVANFDGMQISLAGEVAAIGDVSYFKLTTIPAFPLFEMMDVNLSQMQNQWIKYGEEISPEMKEKQEETLKKLETLFKDKKFFIVKRELPDEKIRDVNTYHYFVALDKEEIKNLLPELFKAMEEFMGPGQVLTEGGIDEFLPEINKFFEKIGEITAEIWIGKKDNYLYKIIGEKEIDMSQFEETAKGTIIIKADIEFSNFNQSVKIEAPKDFKTLEEILPSIYSPEYFEGLPTLP